MRVTVKITISTNETVYSAEAVGHMDATADKGQLNDTVDALVDTDLISIAEKVTKDAERLEQYRKQIKGE